MVVIPQVEIMSVQKDTRIEGERAQTKWLVREGRSVKLPM